MTPVRLALIGFGKWGRNYVRAARESGEAEVTCLVLSEGSPHWKDPLSADFHRSDCMAHVASSVDAFVYAKHPAFAQPACEVALEAGKPILIEKPAGLSLGEAERILAAERDNKGLVLVGHQHLFAEGFEAFRQATAEDAEFFACWTGPVKRDYSPLWDYGPHAVACALAVLGPGAQYRPAGRPVYNRPGAFELDLVAGDRSACLSVGTSEHKRACIEAEQEDEALVRYDAYASEAEPPLTRQVRAFAQAVRAGGTEDWRFGARWAVDVARVLEAAAP